MNAALEQLVIRYTQSREGFIRSLLLVFFKRVVFAVLAVSVIFSTNEACVCRVLIFILNGISGAQLL